MQSCPTDFVFFFNPDSLHARVKSHYKAWIQEKKEEKDEKHVGKMVKKSPKIKETSKLWTSSYLNHMLCERNLQAKNFRV